MDPTPPAAGGGGLSPGRTFGEFVLRERIGEGGFAVVYRAEQPALQREAVIKVLHDHLAARSEVVDRFLREARLSSRLDHPFAAHVYAFGAEPDGQLWIAMELVRGTPMDRLLEEGGPLPLERFVPLFERICEVVHTAHEQGIVHRDLKPANVMVLSRAGRLLPKLLDFGIARVVGEVQPSAASVAGEGAGGRTTRVGAIMGSPLYMAPEQWVDPSTAGRAADLYALGVLAYEALTGRAPFAGRTLSEVAAAHASGDAPPLGAGLPDALDAVLARAFAKRPEDRHTSAVDLAAAVREAAGLAAEAVSLPQLDESLRSLVTAGAPQPVAESVAALEAARNVDQARAILWDVVHTISRWVGILALASRAKIGSGGDSDGEDTRRSLRMLGGGSLGDAEWLELARALTRPFATRHEVHPIPELVSMLHGVVAGDEPPTVAAFDRLGQLRAALDRGAGKGDEERRGLYAEALRALAELLAALAPLWEYTLVVTRAGRCEKWRGLRRNPRAVLVRRARPLPEAEPMLVDMEGVAILRLAPLVQVAAPAEGAGEELFVLEGKGPIAARLVAMPRGFERADPALWDWFREHLFDVRDSADGLGSIERAPYRGLAPFTAEDAAFYLGREREVEAFVNRLRIEPLLAVVGPSGAGKSSFVQAGVLPQLPAGWRAIVVRPGPAPLAGLEARLAREGIAAELSAEPAALGARLREAAAQGGATLVLVIDQLEELFTLCHDPGERASYAAALAGAARSPDDPIRIVLTLRDDFLVRTEELAPLRNRLSPALKLLTTPAAEDLRRIVVEPARRAGYELDTPQLASEMVDEVAGEPGALALISFTAAELWKLRDRHFSQLTQKAYRAIGGVAGALARHADQTLAEMTHEDQRLVREAFRHLVTADGTRQVLGSEELMQLLGGGSRASAVIDRLVSARLLVTSEEEEGEKRIEVIHEALLSAWPLLVKWRQEDAEGARLRDQLRSAARQWDARGRPRGLLWRDDALAEFRIWRARYPGALTAAEEAFGQASVDDAQRGARLRRLALAIAFAILAVGSAVLFHLRQRAEDSSQRATRSSRLASERERQIHEQLVKNYEEQGRRELLAGSTNAALVYLDAALQQGADSRVLRFMIARAMEPLEAELVTLRGHHSQLWTVAFSPDGKELLTAGGDGTARVWEVATGAELVRLEGTAPGETYASWSPDGALVATGGADAVVRLWDARTGRVQATLTEHQEPIHSIAFSPDGAHVASSSQHAVALWKVARGSLAARLDAGEWSKVEFDPSSSRVVTSNEQGVPRIWSLDGELLTELRGHPASSVWYAVWSPAGDRVATTGFDGTARIWDARSGRPLHVLRGHEQRVTHIAFDPRGKRVATASADRTARIWDAATGELLATLRGHSAQVNRVVFSQDGALLVSAGGDGRARVWDVRRGAPTATMYHGGFVFDVSVSPGKIATASWDGSAKVWTLARQPRLASLSHAVKDLGEERARLSRNGEMLVTVNPPAEAVLWRTDGSGRRILPASRAITDAALTPDARTIAVGDRDGTVGIAETTGDGPMRRFHAHPGGTSSVAFAAGGRRLVSGGLDRTIAMWDAATAELVARQTIGHKVGRLLLSPDERLLVVYDQTEAVATLLDGDTLTELARLRHDGAIETASFAPAGRLLATGGADATARIWTAEGRLAATLVHDAVILALTWSPSSDRLVTGGSDGRMIAWSARTWSRLDSVAAHDNWIASIAFSPDGSLVATASGDRSVKLWDARSYSQTFTIGTGGDRLIHAQFDAGGERLVVTGDRYADVWNVAATKLAKAALASFVRCRLRLELKNEQVVELDGDKPCKP